VSDRDHRRTYPFGFRALSMGTGSDDVKVITPPPTSSSIVGTIVFLLPSMTGGDESNHNRPSRFGSSSPFGRNATLIESAYQLVRKTRFFSDGRVNARIITVPEDNKNDIISIRTDLVQAEVLIGLGLTRSSELSFLNDIFESRRSQSSQDSDYRRRHCHFALDCDNHINENNNKKSYEDGDAENNNILSPSVGPYDMASSSSSPFYLSLSAPPWTEIATGKRVMERMIDLFERWTSDDFVYALMVFFNQFCTGNGGNRSDGSSNNEGGIDWVKHSIDPSWEKGPIQNSKEFISMISKCGDCITRCVADEKCKECLDALTEIDTSDQVTSYRTIVSFESKLLEEFSYCILQQNNVFECDASIPKLPHVKPMKTWRGQALTKMVARGLLIGHLNDVNAPEGGNDLDISWKVAAGANVAYDQFPSQNQIFYESANGKSMWYDPVFRVETIDGRNVWCKRHYKVRDGKTPGTFRFSVLDNGVMSDEYWTIVDVADDLSYIIFHYAGAAGAVGQSYLGGLLCTADGKMPPLDDMEVIWEKLRSAGIEPWELFVVDNSVDSAGALEAGPPPLDYFRKEVLMTASTKK